MKMGATRFTMSNINELLLRPWIRVFVGVILLAQTLVSFADILLRSMFGH
jgi:hypothetical protein